MIILKKVLTGRYPDIYLFFVGGVLISAADVFLHSIGNTPLFYNHVVSYGFGGVVISVLFIMIMVMMIIPMGYQLLFDRTSNIASANTYNDNISDYLKSHNIYLRREEFIVKSAPTEKFSVLPSFDKTLVATNQRVFYYEGGRIIWQLALDEISKIEHKRIFPEKTGIELIFYHKGGIKYKIKAFSFLATDLLLSVKSTKNKITLRSDYQEPGK